MGAGKNLVIVAGILTLVGTYALSWFSFPYGTTQYASGIGGLLRVFDLFANNSFYVRRYGLPSWAFIVIGALVILFLVSGALQILVIKKRACGILGTIMPFLMGIALLLGAILNLLSFIRFFLEIFGSEAIIEGILPYHWVIYGEVGSIGSYFILAGGILGLIGVIKSKEEFY